MRWFVYISLSLAATYAAEGVVSFSVRPPCATAANLTNASGEKPGSHLTEKPGSHLTIRHSTSLLAIVLSARVALGVPLTPSVTNALGQVTTFRYDVVGNMTNRTDAAGVATRYLYDGINRLTNIVYASTGQKTILRYDANSNLTNAWATNSTAFAKVVTVAMRYDNRDRLTNATTTAGSASWSVGYRHDLNGNTTNILYPGGLVCTYTFDTQDRCTKVTDWLGRETQFGYDDASRLTSITYPAANGVSASYGYDAMGRRTSYSYTKGSTLAARTLVRNALGFKYQENVTTGYAPAPASQKLRSSTFDTADRFTASTDTPGGSISYGHDAKGNLTNLVSSTSTNVWVWDDDNRLKSLTNNASAVSYLYDALGTRIGTLNGTTTNYFAVNQSAGLKNVLAEMNGAGSATRYYVWGPAGLICHIEAGSNATRYYHQDELGSTLLMTDESGNVTDQFAYQPYGELINRTGSTVTPYKWLGGLAVRDEGNSLYYMLNRYYSADQKRFLTEDPAGIDSWPNLYAYANLNPAFFVDPYGLGADSSGGFAYNGGLLGNGLRLLGGYLENYNSANAVINAAVGFYGSLANRAAGMVSPSSYVNGARQFGGNISTVYRDSGFLPAASYATTSWNVGDVWSGAANIDLATGQPVGNGFERWARASSGTAATAAIAAFGASGVAAPSAPTSTTALSPYRFTASGESFIRYESGNAAYTRMTPSGGVTPGTYAAPASDGIVPLANRAPVYNLPSPQIPRPAVITLTPPAGTPIIGPRPVVGGTGNEVIFPTGY